MIFFTTKDFKFFRKVLQSFYFYFSIFILTTKYAKLFQSIQDFLQELCVILKLRDLRLVF